MKTGFKNNLHQNILDNNNKLSTMKLIDITFLNLLLLITCLTILNLFPLYVKMKTFDLFLYFIFMLNDDLHFDYVNI